MRAKNRHEYVARETMKRQRAIFKKLANRYAKLAALEAEIEALREQLVTVGDDVRREYRIAELSLLAQSDEKLNTVWGCCEKCSNDRLLIDDQCVACQMPEEVDDLSIWRA